MKKVIATVLTVLMAMSYTACKKTGDDPTASSASEITSDTTETATETTDDRYFGTAKSTEAPDYGSSEVADLCELMHMVSGKRVYKVAALTADFFQASLGSDHMGYYISYEDYEEGEYFYLYDYFAQVSKGELSFNKFRFTANQEHGTVHTLEFICSNDKKETDLTPFDLSREEIRKYYSMLEKELTQCFGAATASEPLDDQKLWQPAYAEFSTGNECTFRLEYDSSANGQEVKIKCSNSIERRHFLDGSDLEPSETDENGFADIGENYYKEPAPGDIVTDEKSGRTYVKNQLLISCEMGTPDAKAKVKKICEEIGAEIVGCIELTSDIQIEFKRDMTYDELMKVADELREKYYFILDVTLNSAMPVTYDT